MLILISLSFSWAVALQAQQMALMCFHVGFVREPDVCSLELALGHAYLIEVAKF